jgi:SOS-response transcriptional repressor LexA
LDYLHRYLGEHRRAPFLREIQEACRIVSYKSVLDRLNALERKGFIKRIPNKHRAIHLHHKAYATLQQSSNGPVLASVSAGETSEPVPAS